MTLVLACLTKDTVFQISDRRLTSFAAPHAIIEDERNKAVVVNGRVSFAYTGLASLGTTRTDDWLARVIAEGPNEDMAQVAERIRERATADFRRLRIQPRYKRHAFQGVGMFRLRGETDLSPGIVTIDNAIDHENGNWLAEPLREFQVKTQFPEKFPGGCVLNSVGVVPSSAEKSTVLRLVQKCVNHRHSTALTIVHSLVMSLRWLSGRHPPIGPGLMVVRLSRERVERIEHSRHMWMLAGEDFTYVSATGLTSYFGPHFVFGRSVVTGFEGRSLTPQ